jgi:hypothetical protein
MSEAASRSKSTVAVGCRYPHGLLLRVFDMVGQREPLGGGRFADVKVAQARAEQVKLRGYLDPSIPLAVDSKGKYAVTRDVPADFFERWLKDNADSDIVKNEVVFCADSESELKAKGRDFKDERNGMQPVDPKKPQERMGGGSKMKIEPANAEESAAG